MGRIPRHGAGRNADALCATMGLTMSGANNKRLRAVVQGRVQGVGFRYWIMEQASRLKLVGTCRNLRNGDVEVVAEGEEGALEALVAMLHNGPRMAHVDNVIVIWEPPTGEFTTFSIALTR